MDSFLFFFFFVFLNLLFPNVASSRPFPPSGRSHHPGHHSWLSSLPPAPPPAAPNLCLAAMVRLGGNGFSRYLDGGKWDPFTPRSAVDYLTCERLIAMQDSGMCDTLISRVNGQGSRREGGGSTWRTVCVTGGRIPAEAPATLLFFHSAADNRHTNRLDWLASTWFVQDTFRMGSI